MSLKWRRTVEGRTWQAWQDAKKRCTIPANKDWKHYGGRGIRFCKGLSPSYGRLVDLIGLRPNPSLQLDRKDNNGHYSCGRCSQCKANRWPMNLRWATKAENMRNRRRSKPRPSTCATKLTHNGEQHSLGEWSKIRNIDQTTLRSRIKAGWDTERALNQPAGRITSPARSAIRIEQS